jgi:hypothetical protein
MSEILNHTVVMECEEISEERKKKKTVTAQVDSNASVHHSISYTLA